jgi:hypothetical protein
MDSLACRVRLTRRILANSLLAGLLAGGTPTWAQAQGSPSTPTRSPAREGGAPAAEPPGTRGPEADLARPDRPTPGPTAAQQPRREPSAAYRESLRKTLEKRRQRRARRAQATGLDGPRPVGAIVPWPMPPALIIRHTPAVHGEVQSLLDQLRR